MREAESVNVVQINDIRVEFFYPDQEESPEGCFPCGWEATKEDTTNETGYFNTGGLWWKDKKLIDYDGVFELPLPVKEALKSLGYDISECE